jgi:hypothetical protein
MVISDLGYEGHLFAYKKGSITEDDNWYVWFNVWYDWNLI